MIAISIPTPSDLSNLAMKAICRPAASEEAVQPGTLNQDLHLKMSKKIAQLTKVIFHLNTRNEDHEREVMGLQHSYETEIDQILKDAYAKMTSYRNQIASEFDRDAHKKSLADMAKAHNTELEQMRAAMSELRRTAAECQSETERQTKIRIDQFATSVQHMRDEFSQRFKKLQAAVKHSEAVADELVKAAGTKAKLEVEAVVKKSNEQYNAMLAEKCRDEDRLRLRLANERALALDTQRQQHETFVEALQKQLAGLQNQLDNLRSQKTLELAQVQSDLDLAQRQLAHERNQRIEAERTAEKGQEELRRKHEREIDELKQEIANQECLMKASETAADHEHKLLNENLTKQMQSERDSYESQIANLCARHSQNQQKQEKAISKLQADSEQKLDKLERRLEEAETQSSKLMQDVKDTQKQLNQREQDCTKLRQEQHVCRALSDQTCSRLKLEHDTFITALKAAHEQAIISINAEYCSKRESETRDWKVQLDNVIAKAKAEHDTEKQDLLKGISDLQTELANSTSDFVHTKSISEKQLQDLHEQHAEISTLKNLLVQSQEAHHQKIQSLKKEQRQCIESVRTDADIRLKSVEGKAKKDLDMEREKWQVQTSAMQKRYETKLADLEYRYESQLDQIRKEYENAAEIKLRLEKQLLSERLQRKKSVECINELTTELFKSTAEIDRVKDSLAQTEQKLAFESSEALKQHRAEKQQFLTDLNEERSNNIAILASAQQQHGKELAELKQKHEQDVSKLNQDQQQRLDYALKDERESGRLRAAEQLLKQRLEFEVRMRELMSLHEDKLQATISREQKEKEEAMQSVAIESNLRFDEERATFRASIAQLEKQCEDRVQQMKKQVNVELTQLAALNKKEINETQALVHGKNVELKRARSNQLALEHKISSMEEEAKQLIARYNSSVDQLETQNRWALQKQKSEFDLIQAGLEQDLANLRTQIDEVEMQFRNRESRREDLEKIAQLKRLTDQQQKTVEQSIADMNMFKLELQNRDKNYNERFAAAPRVGTIQLIKPRPRVRRKSTQ